MARRNKENDYTIDLLLLFDKMVYFRRRETNSLIPDNQIKMKVVKKWSKEEYQRHFRNAASNLGMLPEARKWWYRQPLEYRMKQERKWRKRYGKIGGEREVL